MKRMATAEVFVDGSVCAIKMSRYEFNHLLDCVGIIPTPYGTIENAEFRYKLDRFKKALKYRGVDEFTANEATISVAKQKVTFAGIDAIRLHEIIKKIDWFLNKIGDYNIRF